ncbi:hypothetical protein C8R45DRAFT_922273 [Mycena sanguinolenta]|nr:hypothetical protein C8R45DRAFT_922273 [Mycena sanguinolenta]
MQKATSANDEVVMSVGVVRRPGRHHHQCLPARKEGDGGGRRERDGVTRDSVHGQVVNTVTRPRLIWKVPSSTFSDIRGEHRIFQSRASFLQNESFDFRTLEAVVDSERVSPPVEGATSRLEAASRPTMWKPRSSEPDTVIDRFGFVCASAACSRTPFASGSAPNLQTKSAQCTSSCPPNPLDSLRRRLLLLEDLGWIPTPPRSELLWLIWPKSRAPVGIELRT